MTMTGLTGLLLGKLLVKLPRTCPAPLDKQQVGLRPSSLLSAGCLERYCSGVCASV